jgi:integrase
MLRDSDNILERLRSIKIKRHKDIRRPTFREKELNLLLEANQRLKTNQASKNLNEILLKFAFYTGLRVSEICNLNLGDVFLDEAKILIFNGKGGKNRWVAINKALKEDLKNYIENVRGENDE